MTRTIFRFRCKDSRKEHTVIIDFSSDQDAEEAIAAVAKAIVESGLKGIMRLLDVTGDRIIKAETRIGE